MSVQSYSVLVDYFKAAQKDQARIFYFGITFAAHRSITGKSQIKTAVAFGNIAAAVAAFVVASGAVAAAAAESVDDAACTG